jgi:hypothetical protein
MTDREEYEADPQGWIKRNTVDGIRPHRPMTEEEMERRQQIHAEFLDRWVKEDPERIKSQIAADWSEVADTGEINIIRGTE